MLLDLRTFFWSDTLGWYSTLVNPVKLRLEPTVVTSPPSFLIHHSVQLNRQTGSTLSGVTASGQRCLSLQLHTFAAGAQQTTVGSNAPPGAGPPPLVHWSHSRLGSSTIGDSPEWVRLDVLGNPVGEWRKGTRVIG